LRVAIDVGGVGTRRLLEDGTPGKVESRVSGGELRAGGNGYVGKVVDGGASTGVASLGGSTVVSGRRLGQGAAGLVGGMVGVSVSVSVSRVLGRAWFGAEVSSSFGVEVQMVGVGA